MFESCPAQSKLFYTKKFSLRAMKRALKNKKRLIPKVCKPKTRYTPLVSSKKVPEVPNPFEEIEDMLKQPEIKQTAEKEGFLSRLFKGKEPKKVDSPLEEIKKHLDNKEGLIKKEKVKLSKFIEDKERKEKREINEIKELAFGIRDITPKAKKIQVPRIEEKHIHIKPSPIYEVHIIDDLPDPYQLELSITAKKNKALKKLMSEEEKLKKKMSELEERSLVHYNL